MAGAAPLQRVLSPAAWSLQFRWSHSGCRRQEYGVRRFVAALSGL